MFSHKFLSSVKLFDLFIISRTTSEIAIIGFAHYAFHIFAAKTIWICLCENVPAIIGCFMSPLRGFGCIWDNCFTIMSPFQGFGLICQTFSSVALCGSPWNNRAADIPRQQVKVKVKIKVSVNVILHRVTQRRHRVTQRRNSSTLWFSV